MPRMKQTARMSLGFAAPKLPASAAPISYAPAAAPETLDLPSLPEWLRSREKDFDEEREKQEKEKKKKEEEALLAAQKEQQTPKTQESSEPPQSEEGRPTSSVGSEPAAVEEGEEDEDLARFEKYAKFDQDDEFKEWVMMKQQEEEEEAKKAEHEAKKTLLDLEQQQSLAAQLRRLLGGGPSPDEASSEDLQGFPRKAKKKAKQASKVEEEDDDEESTSKSRKNKREEEEDEEEDGDELPRKAKKGPKASKAPPAKKAKAKAKKRRLLAPPPRPDIPVLDKDPFFDNPDPEITSKAGVIVASRDAIRAVQTDNLPLLRKVLADREVVANPYVPRSVDNRINAFTLALKLRRFEAAKLLWDEARGAPENNGDDEDEDEDEDDEDDEDDDDEEAEDSAEEGSKDESKDAETSASTMIVQPPQQAKAPRPRVPDFNLNKQDTGSYSAYSYGHAIRKIGASRGGREGNNALIEDQGVYQSAYVPSFWTPEVISLPWVHEFWKTLPQGVQRDYHLIQTAVECGQREVLGELVKKMVSDGGHEWNAVHRDALLFGPDDKFGPLRKLSLQKWAVYSVKVTPIHLAAFNPNVSVLKQLLKAGGNPSIEDDRRRQPIHYSALCSSPEPLEFLMKTFGADPNLPDKRGITPLMLAAGAGNTHIVRAIRLHEEKELAESQETGGEGAGDDDDEDAGFAVGQHGVTLVDKVHTWTALHHAASNGHADVIKELLQMRGVNVEAGDRNDKRTPLILAASRGHLDCVKVLVEEGKAKVDNCDLRKKTALIYAVKNGNCEVASFLINRGADADIVDSSDNSACHYAAAYGWRECLEFLVETAGADPNVVNLWGLTPLSVASQKGFISCVDYLLNRPGMDVEATDDKGRTLLAQTINSSCDLTLLKFLLEKKANVNAKDSDGNTPLHILAANSAARRNERSRWNRNDEDIKRERQMALDAAALLLSAGADPNRQNALKQSPLWAAITGFDLKMSELLLSHGARTERAGRDANNGNTVYAILASKVVEQQDAVDILTLLSPSDEVNSYNDEGYTPLHLLFSVQKQTQTQTQTFRSVGFGRRGLGMQEDNDQKPEDIALRRHTAFSTLVRFGADLSLPTIKLLKYRMEKGANTAEDEEVEDVEKRDDDEEESDEDSGSDDSDEEEKEKEEDPVSKLNATSHINERAKFGSHPGWTVAHFLATQQQADVRLLNLLVEHRPDLTQLTFDGESPAHLALKHGKLLACKLFLDFQGEALVKQQDKQGRTLLHLAARAGEEQLVKRLLDLGSAINARDVLQMSPLHHAAIFRHAKAVKLLLENGADVHALDDHGRAPLHYATHSSSGGADASADIESLLLRAGAKVNLVDIRGRTPLHYAFVKFGAFQDTADSDPIETVNCLLSIAAASGTPVDLGIKDNFGNTALHYAAQHGSAISVASLLEKGAKNEDQDAFGNTALAIALRSVHLETVIFLLQYRPNVSDLVTSVEYKKQKNEKTGKLEMVLEKTTTKTMFYTTVQNGWQGVSYLLLDRGYPLRRAVADTMEAGKFKLLLNLLNKATDGDIASIDESTGQSLLHVIASFSHTAAGVQTDLLSAVHEMLRRGCPSSLPDAKLRTPLHYAVASRLINLVPFFIDTGNCDVNAQDAKGFSPLGFLLRKATHADADLVAIVKLLLSRGASLLTRFTPKGSKIATTPLIWASTSESEDLLTALQPLPLDAINLPDDQGRTPLMHAVRNNFAKFAQELLAAGADVKAVDNKGWNVIHHLVLPSEIGTWENVALLKVLAAAGADVNANDLEGHTPLYYASAFTSNKLKNALQAFAATGEGAAPLPACFQPVPEDYWRQARVDIGADSKAFLAKNRIKVEKEVLKPSVDSSADMKGIGTVYVDESGLAYDLMMTRVDLTYGNWGMNRFYKMQLIFNKVSKSYVLFTRFGRIGETGQYQRTPFTRVEDGVKEFEQIFRSKTGNAWQDVRGNVDRFEKKPNKYRLMKPIRVKTSLKDVLVPFDLEKAPPSQLPEPVQKLLQDICNFTLLERSMREYGIDLQKSPLGALSHETLEKARVVLSKIKTVLEAFEKERKKESKQPMGEQLHELSAEYYELIPHACFAYDKIEPITTMEVLKKATDLVRQLSDYEIASKILLAAHHQTVNINPLDYCYRALQVYLDVLDEKSVEYGIIKTYLDNTATREKVRLVNVFKIQRRREAKTFVGSKIPNHVLLWHGSKTMNMMGILSQGLRIAPAEAPATGYMFGKGVYFSDMATKSLGYCSEDSKNKYLFLCEVALGKVSAFPQAKYMEKPMKGTNSTMGMGTTTLDLDAKSLVTHDGVSIPLAKPAPREVLNGYHPLNFNEYIVYDEAQVRLRYVLQVRK